MVRPLLDPMVPEGHGIGRMAPTGQNDPMSHSKQLDCPISGWYEPATHSSTSVPSMHFDPLCMHIGMNYARNIHELLALVGMHHKVMCIRIRLRVLVRDTS